MIIPRLSCARVFKIARRALSAWLRGDRAALLLQRREFGLLAEGAGARPRPIESLGAAMAAVQGHTDGLLIPRRAR